MIVPLGDVKLPMSRSSIIMLLHWLTAQRPDFLLPMSWNIRLLRIRFPWEVGTKVIINQGRFYYEMVFLYVDDTAIGTYDLDSFMDTEMSRRFEMTTGANGSTFLGLNVWQNPSTFEITINFKDYLEEAVRSHRWRSHFLKLLGYCCGYR